MNQPVVFEKMNSNIGVITICINTGSSQNTFTLNVKTIIFMKL